MPGTFPQLIATALLTATALPAADASWQHSGESMTFLAGALALSAFALVLSRRERPNGVGARQGPRSEAHEIAELRRYVPGPIADQICHGERLEAGESEVSVMFVDLRGFTALTEGFSPEQVFGFLNRYTHSVSRIVRRHGGFVVEFNGDGMMAVFGAPLPLPDKEGRAVTAARAIVAAVAGLETGTASAEPTPPAVGVGIATGPAYVGNIRAVDRVIWSAVGPTTNRASRLQDLSRSLEASIVIDAPTRRAAGADVDLVRHAQVPVRGLRAPVDVYALPIH